MNDASVDTSGLDRVLALLRRVEDVDARPVLDDWAAILVEDNRAGVLAGLNKDGAPYSPELSYRGGFGRKTAYRRTNFGKTPSAGTHGGFAGTGTRARFRVSNGYFRPRRQGPQTGAANNNLTPAQYRQLSGPFAAPRRQYSRVITNFFVATPQNAGDRSQWVLRAGWKDVVDIRGRPFYNYLFARPGRDYRGVRPSGRQKCREAMLAWFRAWLAQARARG